MAKRMWELISIPVIVLACLFACDQADARPTAEIKRAAYEAAAHYNVNPYLVLAIIQVESRFKPDAVGSVGERGLMQLHPRYFPGASFDVRENIFMGVAYLAALKRQCKPKYKDAWFVCFNWGAYAQIEDPKATEYYEKVMTAYAEIAM